MATGMATPTIERRGAGPGSGYDEAWDVVVLNDDHNTFEGVAHALAQVIPDTTYARGLQIADTVHNRGRATVWSGHRERAEHYWSQLKAHGLTMGPLDRR